MSTDQGSHPARADASPLRRTAQAFGTAHRRAVVATLWEWDRPVSETALVEEVVARTVGERTRRSTAAERRTTQTRLRHRTLPHLVAIGMVERRPDGLALADDAPTRSIGVSPADLDCHGDPTWVAVSTALVTPRRLAQLAVLADGRERSLRDLAEAAWGHPFDRSTTTIDRMRLLLFHVDLPALADVGLVDAGWTREAVRVDEGGLSRLLSVGRLASILRVDADAP